MDRTERLQRLEDAHGDEVELAFVTIDLLHPDLDTEQLDRLRTGLEAAAVPHWYDAAILSALLDVPESEAAEIWQRLWPLTVTEPFPARGRGVGNVHESTRLKLRARIAGEDPVRFATYGARMAELLADDTRPDAQIECAYHLLTADPDRGVRALMDLYRDVGSGAGHEVSSALSVALRELVESELLSGRELLAARLVIAGHEAQISRPSAVADEARLVLEAVRNDGDVDDELLANAVGLVAQVENVEGDLVAAKALQLEVLQLTERYAARRPGELGPQQDLANATLELGWIEKDLDQIDAAAELFAEAIDRFTVMLDDGAAGKGVRFDLSVAWSGAGDLALENAQPARAAEAYRNYHDELKQLLSDGSMNTRWRRELALAKMKLGDVDAAGKDLVGAERAYGEALEIAQSLVRTEERHTLWRLDLATIHSRLGDLADERGDFEAAKREHGRFLEILSSLIPSNESNAQMQREIAIGYIKSGSVAARADNKTLARAFYQKAYDLMQFLVEKDPSNKLWRTDLEAAATYVGTPYRVRRWIGRRLRGR